MNSYNIIRWIHLAIQNYEFILIRIKIFDLMIINVISSFIFVIGVEIEPQSRSLTFSLRMQSTQNKITRYKIILFEFYDGICG